MKSSSIATACILVCAAVVSAQSATAKPPCPRELAISAPLTINEGDLLTFAVAGSDTSSLALQLSYVWTVRPARARVIGGASTPSITIDTTKLNGERVAVSLAVEGGGEGSPCRATAEATTAVVAPRLPAPPHKFAEFPATRFDRDKEQLNKLATFLHNSPEAGAHLIAYNGRGSGPDHAGRLGARARDYLLKLSVISGIDPRWIVAVNGGRRERDTYEFWIVPRGARPPHPTPTVQTSSAADKLPRRQKSTVTRGGRAKG